MVQKIRKKENREKNIFKNAIGKKRTRERFGTFQLIFAV